MRKNFTRGMDDAPTRSAYLLHKAWGRISPKMTISAVEAKKPINDDAMSARVILNKALTATLPNNKVHSNLLPSSRIG